MSASHAARIGEHGCGERAVIWVVAAHLHRPYCPRTFGHRSLWAHLCQSFEQSIRQEHPHHMAGSARLGRHGIHDGTFRGSHRYGGETAVIVGDFRIQHAADGEGGVGVGVVEHHIDAPSAGGRGAFVIHMYRACVGADGDSAADVYDFAVRQIQLGGGFVGACREVADAGAGGLF